MKPWFDQENKQDYFCCMWNLTRECNSCCVGCPFHNNINNRLIDPKKVITFISNNFNFNTNSPASKPILSREAFLLSRYMFF